MRAYVLPVEGRIEMHDITDRLEWFQTQVGGFIEALPVPNNEGDLTAYINEEGKINGLPVNRAATDYFLPLLHPRDYIAGPVVFVGFNPGTGEHKDAPAELPPRLRLVCDEAGRLPRG